MTHKHLAGQHNQENHSGKTSSLILVDDSVEANNLRKKLARAEFLENQIAKAKKKRSGLGRVQMIYDAIVSTAGTALWLAPVSAPAMIPTLAVATAGNIWTRKRLEDIRHTLDDLNNSLDRLDIEDHILHKSSYLTDLRDMVNEESDPEIKDILVTMAVVIEKMINMPIEEKHLPGRHNQQRHSGEDDVVDAEDVKTIRVDESIGQKASHALAWLQKHGPAIKTSQRLILGAITAGALLYKKYSKYQNSAKLAVIDSNINQIRGMLVRRPKNIAQRAWQAAATSFVQGYEDKFSTVPVPGPKSFKEFLIGSPEINTAKFRNKQKDALISQNSLVKVYLKDSILFSEQGKALFSETDPITNKHLPGMHNQQRHAGGESRELQTVPETVNADDAKSTRDEEAYQARLNTLAKFLNFLIAAGPSLMIADQVFKGIAKQIRNYRDESVAVKANVVDATADKIKGLLTLKPKNRQEMYWQHYATQYVNRYEAEMKIGDKPNIRQSWKDDFNASSPFYIEDLRRQKALRRRRSNKIVDAELKESTTILQTGLSIFGLQDMVKKHLAGRQDQDTHAPVEKKDTYKKIGAVLGGIEGAAAGSAIGGTVMHQLSVLEDVKKYGLKVKENPGMADAEAEQDEDFVSAADSLGLTLPKDIEKDKFDVEFGLVKPSNPDELHEMNVRGVKAGVPGFLLGAGIGGALGAAFGAKAGDKLDNILANPKDYADRPNHFRDLGTKAGMLIGGYQGLASGSAFGGQLAAAILSRKNPELLVDSITASHMPGTGTNKWLEEKYKGKEETMVDLQGTIMGVTLGSAAFGATTAAATGAYIGRKIGQALDKELAKRRGETK